jgi:acetyltransferase-like isoleucine patch superfamily enzyme
MDVIYRIWIFISTQLNRIRIRNTLVYYRTHFGNFGENVLIHGQIKIMNNIKNIYLGDHCSLNEGVLLNSRDIIQIGNYVRISPYVQIHTAKLDLSQSYVNRDHITKPVIIEDGVWLASGCIILPGVIIGKGSVIAAGAVLNQDVGEFELWGGVPAKKIGDLPKN